MNGRARRAVRGAGIAGIATVLAATAHTLGGGTAPSALFCAILFLLATPVAVLLAGARAGFRSTAAAVAASQALFHLAFAAVGDSPSAGATAPGHQHGVAGHSVLGHGVLGHDAASGASTWADAAASAHPDMTLAHIVAAVITIAVVRRGDAALAAIRDWIVGEAAVPSPGAPAPRVPRRLALRTFVPHPRRVVPPGLGRRGPPALSRALLAAS